MVATESVSIPNAEYFSTPGLSFSGMKTLAVSPLHYWHKFINPERPKDDPSPEMQLGTALHCAVLEPERFESEFGRQLSADEYPGALITVDDITARLRELGANPKKGARKADLAEQLLSIDPGAIVWDAWKAAHERNNEGRTLLKKEDYRRVTAMADALLAEPRLAHILGEGKPEQAFFVTDPETGINLKAKMDWVAPSYTLDLKTFSQYRGKSIDRAISDAIYYEDYYIQAYFYCYVRALAEGKTGRSAASEAPEYVLAFVESDEPHCVRLKSVRPRVAGELTLHWQQAKLHVQAMMRLYAEYQAEFGERPWKREQDIELLTNEDISQLAY